MERHKIYQHGLIVLFFILTLQGRARGPENQEPYKERKTPIARAAELACTLTCASWTCGRRAFASGRTAPFVDLLRHEEDTSVPTAGAVRSATSRRLSTFTCNTRPLLCAGTTSPGGSRQRALDGAFSPSPATPRPRDPATPPAPPAVTAARVAAALGSAAPPAGPAPSGHSGALLACAVPGASHVDSSCFRL